MLDAKTAADKQVLDTETRSKMEQIKAKADAEALTLRTEAEIKATKAKAEAEKDLIANKKQFAELYQAYPALVRLEEVKALDGMFQNANARVYVGLDQKIVGKLERA